MKKLIAIIPILVVLFGNTLTAQVAINTDGSAPDASAILDLQSTDKGFLPPRMTLAQRDAISNPDMGLIVFNTTTKRPNYYSGIQWETFDDTWASCGNTLTYSGQDYNTVMIGDQCWMAENLNVGTRIDVTDDQADNSTIEKYCYDDNESDCDTYGGLYQWAEVVQYLNGATNISSWDPVPSGNVQGICPTGWHIPSDAEWKTLEGTVDTQYSVGDPEWDGTDVRGFDAGKRLKATTGWNTYNGTDAFGFTVLPGGVYYASGNYDGKGNSAYFWNSTQYSDNQAWRRACTPDQYDKIWREGPGFHHKDMGYSVRCLKD